jgi:tRNA (guanine37-N1)-methyltransferase
MSALFRAPAARGIKKLDTSLFSKVLPTTAASVRDNKLLSSYRKSLEKHNELLRLRTVSPIVDDTNPAASKGQKCLILAAELKRSGELFPGHFPVVDLYSHVFQPLKHGVQFFRKLSESET